MKILLALDGSAFSDSAVEELICRPWPAATKVKALSVAHTKIHYVVPDATTMTMALRMDSLEKEHNVSRGIVARAAETLRQRAPALQVTTAVFDGPPQDVIVEEAKRWAADLILMGSHGRGLGKRLLLGSVSLATVIHAPCSVEIVRHREPAASMPDKTHNEGRAVSMSDGQEPPIDLERALLDPGSVFAGPETLLAHPALRREQKIEILRRWEYDASELAVAEEEGMTGGEPTILARVLRALHSLTGGADVAHSPPTKHGGI